MNSMIACLPQLKPLPTLCAASQSKMTILDEIDSGLDIDAMRDVAKAVNALKRPDSSVLMVTHYKVGGIDNAFFICVSFSEFEEMRIMP